MGSLPVDGNLVLSSAGRSPLRCALSTNALEAAERLWALRQDARSLSDEEAAAITRATFDVDLTFVGLAAVCSTARLMRVADGAEVEVEADVRQALSPAARQEQIDEDVEPPASAG